MAKQQQQLLSFRQSFGVVWVDTYHGMEVPYLPHHTVDHHHHTTSPTMTDRFSNLRPLVYNDQDFLWQAGQAAADGARTSIRRVLRAVAVQALQEQLKPQITATARIVISAGDIEAVRAFCRKLAQKWSDAARAVGHEALADTIQHVGTTEAVNLYFVEDEEANEEGPAVLEPTTGNATRSLASPLMQTPSQSTSHLPQPTPKLTAWARLHKSLPAACGSSLSTAIAILDHWGQRRQLYWNDSWSRTIEAAASEMPYRLYKNNLPAQIELVPVSAVSNDNATINVNNQDGVEHKSVADWLLDRKRKSVGRERLPPKRAKPTVAVVKAPPASRLASDQGSEPFRTGAALLQTLVTQYGETEESLHTVLVHPPACDHNDNNQVALTHPTENDTSSPQPLSLVVGALTELGAWHFHRQATVDLREGQAPPARLARRRRRQAVTERMGNHRDAATVETSSVRGWNANTKSRVLPTSSATAQWREADLQHVVLEVYDATTQTRHLLALESLECLLLDEESQVAEDWHDDPVL